MKVICEILVPASKEDGFVTEIAERYVTEHMSDLRREQHKIICGESDFYTGHSIRYSDDNGRTWGQWKDIFDNEYHKDPNGNYEWLTYENATSPVYNPVHRHTVNITRQLLYKGVRHAAYTRCISTTLRNAIFRQKKC